MFTVYYRFTRQVVLYTNNLRNITEVYGEQVRGTSLMLFAYDNIYQNRKLIQALEIENVNALHLKMLINN